ncbi:phosphotransferase [Nocardia sp. NPDC003979]
MPTIDDLYGVKLAGWRRYAEQGPPADLDDWSRRNLDRLAALEGDWTTSAAGKVLLHTDLRPDNMRMRPDGTVAVVDWAWPCTGAAWVDLVMLTPAIANKGIDPDPILATHPVTRNTDPASINSLLCGLSGYWASASRQPPPPRAPQLREHRARAEHVTTQWLRRRLGWP